jgi:predicted MFS family arabinose efflux permease
MPGTGKEPSQPMSPRARAIILAGFLTVSIAYAIRYGYGMLLPAMLPALAISKAQAGAIFSTYFAIYTLATPVLGALSDRFNYRLLLCTFTAVMAAGVLLMAKVENLLQIHIFYALAALGHAACWAPVTALVQKWVPDHKRGTALSLVTMGVGLGIPLWSVLLPAIVDAADWRAGWWAMGLFALGVAVLNFILVRNPLQPDRADESRSPRQPGPGAAYRDLFKTPLFWTIGTAYLFVGFNVIIVFTFLPIYAREVLELPYALSTRFVAVIALSGIVGQLTLGPLSDTMGRMRVMVICGLVMGAACLGMGFVRAPWALYALTAFYGWGYGAVWPVYAAAARDFFDKTQTGGIVGLWTVFLGLGSVTSPVLCGWSIDHTGAYAWTFLLGLISGLLSAVILFATARRPRG